MGVLRRVKAAFFSVPLVLLLLVIFDGAAAARIIRIAATGDIMLGTGGQLPADEAAEAFAAAAPYLKDCQVIIGNLEGPLSDKGAPTKNVESGSSYVFRTPPHYVKRLSEAGFTVLNLANNHVNDYGPLAAAQTREVLDEAGLLYTGGPGEIARQKVGRTTVSVIGLAPNSGCQDINDIPAAEALVKQEAADKNTLVVVVFHGGGEGAGRIYVPDGPESFLGENRGDLRRLGRALIDAGAHLVIGHGPHVPRGLEIYKDRLIAYSLGNFATGRGISISGPGGLAPLLLVDLDSKGRLAGGQVVSFKQLEAGKPVLDEAGEAVKLMHTLSLTDFELPALAPDGQIMLTSETSRLMAAALPRPARPKIIVAAARPQKAEAAPEAKPAEEPKKSRKKPTAKKSSGGYEWDVYADLRKK